MKENLLDVLMYLFENYMNGGLPVPDEESLKSELHNAGFPASEINKAFAWLEGLAELRASADTAPFTSAGSVRVFAEREIKKLDLECRGFLMFLEQLGVLDPISRELVLDRIIALESQEIDLEQIKWVVLMVLFNQPGHEAAYAWMEDLVYDEMTESLH